MRNLTTRWLILPSFLLGFVPQHIGAQPQPLGDSLAFAVVVAEAQKKFGARNWTVVLQPFEMESPTILEEGSQEAHLSSDDLAARRKHLRQVNLRIAGPISLRNCSGLADPEPPPNSKTKCPTHDSVVVAVGVVREGGYKHSLSGTDSLSAADHRTIRMLAAEMSPQGSSLSSFDVTLKRSGQNWVHLKTVPIMIAE